MGDRVTEIMARAIKAADGSFFNEDYSKQAMAAQKALNKAGYEIVPIRPSQDLSDYIDQNLPVGRHRPRELVHALYALIVENARRFEP